MLVLLLGAALIQADSVYASPALREAVARAAALNREPPELYSYRALVESEAALVIHTAAGEELTGQIEQIASHIQWWRDGNVDQHVVGHRIQSVAPTWSVLTYLRVGWIFPVLYGERLGLLGISAEGRAARRRAGYRVVHPFSAEREHTYRFEGGDTIAVLRLPDRVVRVMRIRVTPRRPPHERALAFHGDIDLDADRHQIVRMRGRLVIFGPEPGPATRLLSLAARGFAYIELENAEYEGRYWLPFRQRLEFQATSHVTDSRAVVRIVSTFRDHRIELDEAAAALALGPQRADSVAPAARGQVADTAGTGAARAVSADSALAADTAHAAESRQPRFRLTFAPADTFTAYDDWSAAPGEATAGLSARDFDDVAPPALRADGPPHVRLGSRRITDVLRFNRIEGLFTGAGAVLAFRDAAPGLELRAAGGWAWSQRTPRGYVELALRRDEWELGVRAARDLDHTNDFAAPLEQGAGVFMLFGAGDDYDYVDRRGVVASVARSLGHDAGVRFELGLLEDRPEVRRRLRGPYGGDTLRLNRPAAPGNYIRSRLVLERGRSVNGSSLQPGLGVRAVIEHAAGELDWSRVESGLSFRTTRGRFIFSARFDAGLVLSDAPPPQTLYELGTAGRLPGYPYKAFGGDRAALLRGSALYDLPIPDAPIRIGALVFPGLSPAPTVRWEAGWAAASERALPALQALGSRETGGVRSTVALQLTFFGGMLGVGVARPIEAGRDWEPLVSIGTTL